MSNKSQFRITSFTRCILSCLVVLGLSMFIPFYIISAGGSPEAYEQVWDHLERLSLMAIAYWFGNKS